MTEKRSDERRKLVSLADALLDDLFATSDEDILAEIEDAGGNAAALSNQMRAQFEETVLQGRKERMKAAKVGVRAAKTATSSEKVIDIAQARRVLRQAYERDGISMAARNETESNLTAEEVLQKYNDLVELGLIVPEEGEEP